MNIIDWERKINCKSCGVPLSRKNTYIRNKGKRVNQVFDRLCKQCKIEQNMARSVKRRQMRKLELIRLFGGRCSICSYKKNAAALVFHHVNPEEKHFDIGTKLLSYSFNGIVQEAKKCILICNNCHAEQHHPELTLG